MMKSYRFASYTSVYAGSKEFRRMCSSLSDKVDFMIVHYGRYLGYDEELRLTEDSTRLLRIAKEYGCKIEYSDPCTELAKRQQTGSIAKDYGVDFLLIIDSDEYIDPQTNWDAFRQNAIDTAVEKYKEHYNIFGIRVEDGPQTFRPLPRLWFRPEFIYYDRTHYGVKTSDPNSPFKSDTKEGEYERHPIIEVLPYLTIRSNTDFRTGYQKNNRASYGYILNNLDNEGLVN